MSFRSVSTDQGTFNAITSSGELLWYRDLKRDGTNGAHAETSWDIRPGGEISIRPDSPAQKLTGCGV